MRTRLVIEDDRGVVLFYGPYVRVEPGDEVKWRVPTFEAVFPERSNR